MSTRTRLYDIEWVLLKPLAAVPLRYLSTVQSTAAAGGRIRVCILYIIIP